MGLCVAGILNLMRAHETAPTLFWLGTGEVSWLGRTDVPLFISRRRLARQKRLPRALGPWALDSGGFSELWEYGRWTITPEQYVAEATDWSARVGNLAWAACQDWMCEPIILHGGKVGKHTVPGTHLSVPEHQRLTVESYLTLCRLAPSLPWAPVLQGWTHDDYLAHVEQYAAAGVDLAAQPIVGLGSVCRRQDTRMAEELAGELKAMGIRLHGFGFKTEGLLRSGHHFASADSMAWSAAARRRKLKLPECEHRQCNNCLRWALRWRDDVLGRLERNARRPVQSGLFDAGA